MRLLLYNKFVIVMTSQVNINKIGQTNKRLKFTYKNSMLTEEEKQHYEDKGYLLFKKFVNDDILDDCRQRFLEICEGKCESGGMTVMQDLFLRGKGAKSEYLINKIQDIGYDEVLFKYFSHKKLLDVIEGIIGPNITLVHSMLINKPPDSTSDYSMHPLHQDLHYFPFRPADYITASWTAMELVNEQNGCLFVIPGSHKGDLLQHRYQNVKNKAYHGVGGYEYHPKVNLIMDKGDTVFFHPLLLHGSGPNLTKGFRKAISGHYADSNCYFIDVRGTSQDIIANEIEVMLKKKGLNLKYEDVWKYKSRLVKGNPGNFHVLSSQL